MATLGPSDISTPVLSLRALSGIFLFFLLCFLILSTALPILFVDWAPKSPMIRALAGASGDPALVGEGVARLILPWLIFGILLLGLKVHFAEEPLRKVLQRFGLGSPPPLKNLTVAFIAGFLTINFFTKLLIPSIEGEETLISNPADQLNLLEKGFLLILLVNTFTLVPVAEELLFRGVLYTGLATLWNRPLAMIVTSVGFMALHPGNLSSGSTLTHLAMLVVTTMLVMAREMTGAVYVPIMLHAGFNFPSISIS